MTQHRSICVVGLGFVGLPLAAVFADLGVAVTGVDAAQHVLRSLRGGKAHFEEDGLQEMLDRVLKKNLTVAEEIGGIAHDIFIIAVGTPIDDETKEPILDQVENAARAIGKALKKDDLVVMRSTVPVGTTRGTVLHILETESGLKGGENFDLVYAPERLVSGKALAELRTLPQPIGGLTGKRDVRRAQELFLAMTPKIVIMENLEAGELGKLIDNAYRDCHFAFANQIARLCETIPIDAVRLIRDVNRDYPRNRIPAPSPGVGGICLMKDPHLLAASGRAYGYHPTLTEAARAVNAAMPSHVSNRVLSLLRDAGKEPKRSVVFILGFAFKGKPPTSDARNAPTTTVVKALKDFGCAVRGYDPVVPKEHIASLNVENVSVGDGFKGADAAVIMTNHPMFEALDMETLIAAMNPPPVLFDGWRLFDPAVFRSIPNLRYSGIGYA